MLTIYKYAVMYYSQRNQYEDLKLVGLCEKSVMDIFFCRLTTEL